MLKEIVRLRWARSESIPHPVSTLPPPTSKRHPFSTYVPRRLIRLLTAIVIACVLGISLLRSYIWQESAHVVLSSPDRDETLPPTYHDWYEREKSLPQHDVSLPYPQGREGHYLWIANHATGVGWGNVMQEALLNAHLAYLSRRIYVFDSYTWNTDTEYSDYNGHLIPSRIPLTALVSGPMAGAAFVEPETHPPAVIPEFFHEVCHTKTVIDPSDMRIQYFDASAMTTISAWLDKLARVEDRCVEIMPKTNSIFEFWIFGSSARMLDIWPSFSKSPILTQFAWSPLVTSAVEANRAVIHPSIIDTSNSTQDLRAPLPGLLALHIRRGDFDEHCKHFARWSSRYNAFNEIPSLPDKFEPPEGGGAGENTPENFEIYTKHCFPTIEQIVGRVAEVLKTPEGQNLSRVYVLTNGKKDWLDELISKLRELKQWESVHTSRDLHLSWEQRFVAQAVDMLIAQRAEVYIGNGFSSLTSNVNVLRLSHGFKSETTRFW